MTNEELLEIGTADGALVALVSETGEVVWSAQKSPVGTIVKAMLANEVPSAYALVATQLGAALSTVGQKLGVKRLACRQLSEPGRRFLESADFEFFTEEDIDLVKSSKDPSKVCPVEAALSTRETADEMWAFLEKKFSSEESPSCNVPWAK